MKDLTDILGCAETYLRNLSPRAQAVTAIVALLGLRAPDGAVPISDVKRALNLSDADWTDVREELRDTAAVWLAGDIEKLDRLQSALTDVVAYEALGAPGRPSSKDWDRLRAIVFGQYAEIGVACTYCYDTEGPFVLDHVHPVSRGGSNHPLNLTPACERCNSQKGAMPWAQWSEVLERRRSART